MSLFFTVLAFILIFSLLILIHEFGHFYAAKKCGVKVEEFGMGLPPRIWGFKKGETLYSINWIPFGGFVRTLGEGDDSKEGKTSPRSFKNKSLRAQALIVCAGVLMNFLLSFVLLTVGFWIGIEPLIATQEDFLKAVREGLVDTQPGIVVVESRQAYNTVDYNGQDLEIRSFEPGDRLLGFETVEEWQATVQAVEEGGEAPLIPMDRVDGTGGAEYLTKELLDQTTFAPLYFSGLIYQENPDSIFAPFLKQGDALISLSAEDGTWYPLLTADDLNAAFETGKDSFTVRAYRAEQGDFEFTLQVPQMYPVVSFVEAGSPAETAGLVEGTYIERVSGVEVHSAEQVLTLTREASKASEASTGEFVVYEFLKPGAEVSESVSIPFRADGRIGVGLSDLLPNYGALSLYEGYVPYTLIEMNKIQLGAEAPLLAGQEMWRLGKMTAVSFVQVLKQFVTAGGVPEGVSGPVGIAQMTGVTIQDGFAATLRFVAMLSLSLGVINILPFPALDGGHFAGILFQAITGKKGASRWSHLVNTAGFVFLLLFIVYITFNDVLNLF